MTTMTTIKHSLDNADPLTLAMAPPPNETPHEQLAREQQEERAREVSKRIDAEIRLAKTAMKKMQRAIKVLVLGQSLSGKSTTIKNFQMTYAQRSWMEERDSWKAVILLNLVQSVNVVVNILAEDLGIRRRINSVQDGSPPTPCPGLTERHKSLALKLAPLQQIERDLKLLIGSGSSENPNEEQQVLREFSLRSSSGWKAVLNQIRNPSPGKDRRLQQVACDVVFSLKSDITELWNDAAVQRVLTRRQIRLEDSPGFFLQDVNRIAQPEYIPSDTDVVRARLRTTGVQEYHFTLDRGTASALDWLMYDVAGIRTSRAAWIPYFKDITAIIFLAPLSAFNETLREDPSTNSMRDTFSLWKTVCSNKLLAKVQIILFMNKTDLLEKKLDSGLRVRDYLSDFHEKSNDFTTVTTWFRRMFAQMYRENSPSHRQLIAHFTSVIDTQATAQTLAAVQGIILRKNIVDAGLM